MSVLPGQLPLDFVGLSGDFNHAAADFFRGHG